MGRMTFRTGSRYPLHDSFNLNDRTWTRRDLGTLRDGCFGLSFQSPCHSLTSWVRLARRLGTVSMDATACRVVGLMWNKSSVALLAEALWDLMSRCFLHKAELCCHAYVLTDTCCHVYGSTRKTLLWRRIASIAFVGKMILLGRGVCGCGAASYQALRRLFQLLSSWPHAC